MANPPIVIGAFANVPAPGSPIRSDWAQQATRAVIHVFASIAARDAWTGPPDGARCYVTANQRDYRRVGGVWESVPIVIAGQVTVTGDASGNASFNFARPFPAVPNPVMMSCIDFANVGCIPFSVTASATGVGLRRPADNTPVTSVAVNVAYIAVLL